MKIKYNRFALLPHCCVECDHLFWLEPYRKDDGLFSGYEFRCTECANKLYELYKQEEERRKGSDE